MWWWLDASCRKKSYGETRTGQNLFRRFQRQSDDVRKGAAVPGHDQLAMLLNRVTAGFVERMHLREIGLDRRLVQRLEHHLARDALVELERVARPAQRHAGEH